MTTMVAALALLFAAQSDPNRLPPEEAKGYAKLCVEQVNLTDAQIGMAVDAEKPCAVRGEGGGAMLIPDKSVSVKLLQNTGKEIVPLGQLWLRKWRPAIDGKLVPDDKLRIVAIKIDDKDRPMPLLLLGVRKKDEKDLELVVYAKAIEPLMVLPMKPAQFVQELPVEVKWERGENTVDALTLTILGKYQAVVPVGR